MSEGDEQVLIRYDSGRIPVSRRALRPYRLLLDARENLSGKGNLNEIDLHFYSKEVVKLIVSWAERHKNDPHRREYKATDKDVTVILTNEDDKELKGVDIDIIFAAIQAADEKILLDFLDALCQVAAKWLEQEDPIRIRDLLFDGKSGFDNEEEENQLREENEAISEL